MEEDASDGGDSFDELLEEAASMTGIDRRFVAAVLGILIAAVGGAAQAAAQGGLKTINPAQGGRIVYGQVDGQNSEAGAMGAVLKSVHSSLGDKPEVGKLFQVRGTDSTAVFFSAKRRNGDGGQVAGLIIATRTGPNSVEAALVSDDAARFPKTLGPMMKALFGVWHPAQAVSGSGSGPSGAAAVLHQTVLPDRSASVSLPEGWQVSPQSGGGTIVATGPNGELATLGQMFLAQDTNNPRVQQTMRTLQNGGLRNTVYAKALYYPAGGDISRTFVAVLQNARQKSGAQPAKFNIASAAPTQSDDPRLRCANIDGAVDFSDGKGDREFMAIFCVGRPSPMGTWASTLTATSAPVGIASRERTTMASILESFNINQAVVQGEAAQYAAPAIAQIHAIGHAAAQQAQAAHAAEDAHNQAVYARWDNNDKHSQEFENYQLGMSVISDVGNNAHGTLWDQDAAALVQANPDRFQYVSAPDYWKGIDY